MKTIRIFGFEIRRLSPFEKRCDAVVKSLDDAALRHAFALADNDPRWRAWRQLIITAIDENAGVMTSSGISSDHGQLAFYAGGTASLRQFLDYVEALRSRALEDVGD